MVVMSIAVECFRCFKAQWHATGRFEANRRGLRRAECVCDGCGYVFFSGRESAIQAAHDALAATGAAVVPSGPPVTTGAAARSVTQTPKPVEGFSSSHQLVADLKRKLLGGEGDGA